MMRPANSRTVLRTNDKVLTANGVMRVVNVTATGVTVETHDGSEKHLEFTEIDECRPIHDGHITHMASNLRPLWDSLPEKVCKDAEFKLQIVLEIVTGHRDGHHLLARPGEPHHPFGESYGVSELARCKAMAELLAQESRHDRSALRGTAREEYRGKSPTVSTIRSWVRRWREEGLVGLIDGRAMRDRVGWSAIDPKYRAVAEKMVRALDGDRSAISLAELDRRVRAKLKKDTIEFVEPAQRRCSQYLSWLMSTRGTKTQTQKSRALQAASGTKHYPALSPGQVVAIDATRADCLVRDAVSGEAISVEVLSAIDVATRVIVALRVVPKSADAIDAGLLLYDICRPFSMLVAGTSVSDWRWCGLPGQLTLPVDDKGRTVVSPSLSTLQGEHAIPSVMPDAIRSDHGANFMSTHFQDVLASLGIDFLPSRGSKPTDNPHVERWHETLQRAWQQIPGYKGRNVGERGARVATENLLTAPQLEHHLRKFVSLDYHRTQHTGIVVAGDPAARLTPLEMWDILTEATGRIDVPQRSDMIFDFLPIHWATIRHDGVTIANYVYDASCLNGYRTPEAGRFRDVDAKAPFYKDPHDVSRVWFRDPQSSIVHEVPWRGAHLIDAPMTDTIAAAAYARIRARGGGRAITSRWTQQLILDELTELTEHPERFDEPAKLRAARMRREQSRRDFADVATASENTLRAPRSEAEVGGDLLDLDAPWEPLPDTDRW